MRNHALKHIKGYVAPKTNEVKEAPKLKKIGTVDIERTLVRALKLSYKVYSKILGIEEYVDSKVAIATLESSG